MLKKVVQETQQSFGLLRKSYAASILLISSERLQSTASTEAKPERINKNLSFRPAYDSPIDQESRPLVLLYGWLVAKSRHIHKYGDFYLKKGYDVLHIKVDPFQLLWPVNAQKVVQHVADFTQQAQRTSQPILVHGFSVGGYLYGETLVNLVSNEKSFENLKGRIKGQILDSPVDLDRIPIGVSRAVTQIPILQKSVQATISSYLSLTRNTTGKHYQKSSKTFRENPFNAPTLFLFSEADVIGVPEPIRELAQQYTSRGIDVYSKCWPDSLHVSHFHTYPMEYIGALNHFLQQIGLLTEPVQEKIKMSA